MSKSTSKRDAAFPSRNSAAERLADVHEVIDRWLDRALACRQPADAESWARFSARLDRLLRVERRLLVQARSGGATRPVPASHDPLSPAHRAELGSLLDEAAQLAQRGRPWQQVIDELVEFLSWSFHASENPRD